MFAELLGHPGVREVVSLRSRFGFLAFHGGSLEKGTDDIAMAAAEAAGASLYAVLQPPELRWHLPSAEIDPAASPALREFLGHVREVVAVHGYGRPDRYTTILLGGGNRDLARELAGPIRRVLPDYTVLDELEDIPRELRGLHPDNPVNLAPGGGVQLELPPRVRGLGPYWDDPQRRGTGPRRPHTQALIDALALGLAAAGLASVAGMDLRIFTEPQQGASYLQLLAVARQAEASGFDGFFRSDHYLRMGDGDGRPGPTDTWVTLGAIARETSTIRLGTLVCSATFRLPGPLAVAVAQVDEMSGGRVELGIGAGWFDDEHLAYGIPFPPTGQRFDMLREQLEIITGLWRTPPDSQYSFEGDHYTLVGSPALPKARQPGGPPIIIGGYGAKRTPRLAATYATEFNVPFAPVPAFVDQRARVAAACEAIDRDPDDLIWSVALVACCGRTDREVERRAAAIGRGLDGDLRQNGATGSPAEVLEILATYAEAGVQRVYLQILDVDDLDHIALIGEEVLPLLV